MTDLNNGKIPFVNLVAQCQQIRSEVDAATISHLIHYPILVHTHLA